MASPRDTYTLKSAAARAGVSVSTMRRRKDALIAAGATVEPSGWTIPLRALETVFGVADETPTAPTNDTDLVAQLRAENDFLRRQVEQQARTIERQAEAHAVISAQLTKLGQLEAGTQPAPAPEAQPAPRRRWWQRR